MYLPMDGEIIFGDGVVWGSSEDLSSCKEVHSGHVVTFISDPDDWFGTGNWEATDNDGKAFGEQDLLDIENVPCDTDKATFPTNNSFTVSISSNVHMQSLTVWNQQMSTGSFASYRANEGKYQFVDSGDASMDATTCSDASGCICHQKATNLEEIFAKICDGKCGEDPSCLKPIDAVGQCCQTCGSLLMMNYTDSYTEKAMREYLRNYTNDPKYPGSHATLSKISPDMVAVQSAYQQKEGRSYAERVARAENEMYIQILITDEEAGVKSGDVAKSMAEKLYADLSSGDNGLGISSVAMQSSGAGQNPSTPGNVGTIVGIVIGILAGVLVLTGAIVYCMKSRPFSGSKFDLPFKSEKKTFENPMYPVAAITEVGPGREHESTDDHPNVPEPVKPVSEVADVGMPQQSAMDSDFGVTFGNPLYDDDYM